MNTNSQTTNNILMIRPVNFGYNLETAATNHFQNSENQEIDVNKQAQLEFDNMVNKLLEVGIKVKVIEDTENPYTPDSIFPNNWISFHDDGKVVLYPMEALNRRKERREDIISEISKEFSVKSIIDLSSFESQNEFLEGTGSMVLDRNSKICYACLSSRTSVKVLNHWNKEFPDYKIVSFEALDSHNLAIYHTNVMMCIGDGFAVICLDSIKNLNEKEKVKNELLNSNKEIIEITLDQMNHFAGNMLLVSNDTGKYYLCMSTAAHNSLNDIQLSTIQKYAEILSFEISTIEKNGGGSVRCMMAEIHLINY